MLDLKKSLTEVARWYILVALDAGRPLPVSEDILLRTLDDVPLKLTHHELRRELDYLRDRKIIEVQDVDEHWSAQLTALGVDIVEYTVECRPGIARPPRR